MNNNAAITIEDILNSAPAIGTMEKSPERSKRYVHIPTKSILDMMESNGYVARNVNQKVSGNYAGHLIRFSPESYDMWADHPEIVVYNSHDGKGSLRIEPGFYRQVCTNGLIIQTKDLGNIRYRHMKTTVEDVIKSATDLMENMSELIGMMDSMKHYTMTDAEMLDFAKFAARIRFQQLNNPKVDSNLVKTVLDNAYRLLTPWRDTDNKPDLWTVYNRIQENCIKGGQNLNRRRMRAIRDPKKDLLINRMLSNWAFNLLEGKPQEDDILEANMELL